MTADIVPRMACRTCRVPLNRYVDLDTGTVTYLHPDGADIGPAPHRPDPAPLDDVDARHVCDFCNDEHIAYTVHTVPISIAADTGRSRLVEQYGTAWSACWPCARHLAARDLDALHRRLLDVGPPLDRQAAAAVRVIQQTVLRSLLPGRTVAAIGHWPAVPVPAGTLPKVRDRLATFIGGPDGLPLGLDDPPIRAELADSVSAARLYWIDAEFTDLAEQLTRPRPAITLHEVDLPAPHGVLAWARPVGPNQDLVAASWSSGPDGVRVVGYRSIGAGLPDRDLQQLRAEIGWLGPRLHTRLSPGEPVDTSHPAAVLVLTWLLIAHRLAEAVPAPVDKAIRKAYQRTGRPAPEVRLVRIRPTGTNPSPAAATGSAGAQQRTYTHRWWVGAHVREQPYGPGRALRRTVIVLAHVRGPQDKPIRASTTVRILAAPAARPDTPPRADTAG